ncbi:MAG: hypothetical protein WB441_05990 [Nocardioidaceae bacterium]
MSTQSPQRETNPFGPAVVHPEGPASAAVAQRVVRYGAAALRLSIGWVFAWAFLDKTFGLGHATAGADAWVRGGSPTAGFLSAAPTGPFEGVFHGLAGQPWADWLFMTGLLGIGAALLAGVAMRLAAAAGALMLFLMWLAVLPPANNPVMDDHLVYAMVLVVLAALGAGHALGLGRAWESLPVVSRHRWLW